MANEVKVGMRIKMFRDKLKMTLGELSAKSGVSVEVIASIEDGEVLPALGVLTKLSRALGQRLGTFMDDQFKPDPIITRAAENDGQDDVGARVNGWGYSARSLAPGKPDRQMDPYHLELPADGQGMESSHEGEELVICVSGQIELAYGGETTVLGPGDTAYYNSVVKHAIRAVGGKPASAYGVVFLPL